MSPLRRLYRKVRDSLLADARFAAVVPEHFRALDDPAQQRDLFVRSVRMVEVEVHSHCNRRCWFCPNSVIDRRSMTEYLAEAIYLRLIEDLRACDRKDMVISFSRYSEPFSDDVFYARLAQARKALPNVLLHTNTNGDYLTDTTLARARDAGLDRLHIQLYLAEDQRCDEPTVRALAEPVRQRLGGVRFRPARFRSGWIGWTGEFRGMSIRMYARDFRADGVNRCDLAIRGTTVRRSPCLRPFAEVYVDYNAAVVPCCNLRSDFAPHLPAVWGWLDASPGSVFRVFSGAGAAAWRRAMIAFDPKAAPCEDCAFDPVADTRPNRRAVESIRRRIAEDAR